MKRNEEIKTYLEGNRKGKKAHSLERDALNDPFLYEALEGLTLPHIDPLDGLIRLDRELDECRGRTGRKRSWLVGVAAAIVLLAGVTFYLVLLRPSRPEEHLAYAHNRLPDSLVMENLDSLLRESRPEAMSDTDYDYREEMIKPSLRRVSYYETDAARQWSYMSAPPAPAYSSGEEVRDDSATPEPAAPPKPEKPVEIPEPEGQSVGEAVVVTPKKEDRSGLRSGLNPGSDLERFNEYLARLFRTTENEVLKGDQGKVHFSFEVNQKGVPSRISIQSGISRRYNAEVISLLVDGPRWEATPCNQQRRYLLTVVRDSMGHTAAELSVAR